MTIALTLRQAIESACAKTPWATDTALVHAVERLIGASTSKDATWQSTAADADHPGVSVTIGASPNMLIRFYPSQNKIEIAPRSLPNNASLRKLFRAAVRDHSFVKFDAEVVRVDLALWMVNGASDVLDRAVVELRDAMVTG